MNPETFTPAPLREESCGTDSSGPAVRDRLLRILVAEDDEGMRRLITSALIGGGFTVHAAADGEFAWDELHCEHYDLLVTDNEMPRLTGIKLVERIRKWGLSLPVIMASGAFPLQRAGDAPPLQVAAFLLKPFDIPELLDIVRDVLASSIGDTTEPMAFHPTHATPTSVPLQNQPDTESCKP
jgi:DNA-binding NtrC family response regulator